MRNHEETIKEAELLASSPEAVAGYLKERASRLVADSLLDEGDEQMELTLLGRQEPLIDLTLARYCRHIETAEVLFYREPPNKAVRLAVLSNQVMDHSIFVSSISDLLDGVDKDKLRNDFFAQASDEELYALFQNPKLDDSFLRDSLRGNELWPALSEEKRLTVVTALHNNQRMKTPHDGNFVDGYAEYSYGVVFDAGWKLAETVSVTDEWASALSRLYDQLELDCFSIKQPVELASRWVPQDKESIEREQEFNSRGFTSDYQGVRKALAKLAFAYRKTDAQKLLDSEDIAFRAAAYSFADLTVEQIAQAYEKDGELAFQELVHNINLWTHANKRQALRDVAWSVVNANNDSMAVGIFNDFRDRYAKERPDWFRDEENFTTEPSDEPATKADIEGLASRLAAPNTAIELLKAKLDRINSRLGFVWWFSLGALVGAFSRHL